MKNKEGVKSKGKTEMADMTGILGSGDPRRDTLVLRNVPKNAMCEEVVQLLRDVVFNSSLSIREVRRDLGETWFVQLNNISEEELQGVCLGIRKNSCPPTWAKPGKYVQCGISAVYQNVYQEKILAEKSAKQQVLDAKLKANIQKKEYEKNEV